MGNKLRDWVELVTAQGGRYLLFPEQLLVQDVSHELLNFLAVRFHGMAQAVEADVPSRPKTLASSVRSLLIISNATHQRIPLCHDSCRVI